MKIQIVLICLVAPALMWTVSSVAAAAQGAPAIASDLPGAVAAETAGDAGKVGEKPQTKCPIRGGAINRKLFADVEGYRIYVCCSPCLAKVRADPQAAIAKIRANGEEPEQLPAAPQPKAPDKTP
jgi:hypothetical protein